MRGGSSRHREIHVGRVVAGTSPHNGLLIASDGFANTLKRGDGIVVGRGMPQEEDWEDSFLMRRTWILELLSSISAMV